MKKPFGRPIERVMLNEEQFQALVKGETLGFTFPGRDIGVEIALSDIGFDRMHAAVNHAFVEQNIGGADGS